MEEFTFKFQATSVKLGGALHSIAEGQGHRDNAFTVAYLKRALDELHQAQGGLAGVARKKLLPEKVISEARSELFEVREGILRLMDELRGRDLP